MSLKLKAKRSKKGISGAVTALILVIASVIIALVVVGFAFGLFGAIGGTPTVTQVGTGALYNSTSQKGYYEAIITLHSTGNVQIVSATIVGTSIQVGTSDITGAALSAGANTVTIYFPTAAGFTPQPGSVYQISLGLSDGTTVQVAVTYTGTT
ncbi:DUF973 family protein [Stygiolobus azoricus]|uniref:DUF973 family protein n=1 Tax=Stygiolobus azoricus TaxID=41675 RepID=A0A650CSN0_9CREN|nr:DUF973 family protein [Stygiolobus azoricus]QGR20487.1 DUF973 family protein [Stygiolobus azoricus]